MRKMTMMIFSHMIWKRIARDKRKVDFPVREPLVNVMRDIWPAKQLEPQGTLGLPRIASTRL